MNYHIGRLVLSSLCVGALVWLVLGGVRFAGFSLQNEHHISGFSLQNEHHLKPLHNPSYVPVKVLEISILIA